MPYDLRKHLAQPEPLAPPQVPKPDAGDEVSLGQAFQEGRKETITSLVLHGLPEEDHRNYGFWDKVAKGVGSMADPVDLLLLLASRGVGGAVLKKLAVKGGTKLVTKFAKGKLAKAALKEGFLGGAAGQGLGTVKSLARQSAEGDGIDIGQALGEGAKEGIAFAAAAPIGAIPVGGRLGSQLLKTGGKLAGEGATMATVGAGLEGHLPTVEDLGVGMVTAGVMGGGRFLGAAKSGITAGARPLETHAQRTRAQRATKDAGSWFVGLQGKTKSLVERVGGLEVYEKFVDKIHASARARALTERLAKGKVAYERSSVAMGRLYAGWALRARSVIDTRVRPLVEGFKSFEFEELSRYIFAKRFVALAEHNPKKFNGKWLEKRGFKAADLDNAIADYQLKYDHIAKALVEIQAGELKAMYGKQGEIIREGTPEYYTPMWQAMESALEAMVDPSQVAGRGLADPVKPMSGGKGKGKLLNPLQASIENIYNIHERGAFLKVQRAMVAEAKAIDYRGIAKLKGRSKTATPNLPKDIVEIWNPEISRFERFKLDGALARSLANMQTTASNPMLKLPRFFAKTLRIGATLTPEFQIKNFARDSMAALAYSKYKILPHNLLAAIGDVIGRSKHYREWEASGAGNVAMTANDRKVTSKNYHSIAKAKGGILQEVRESIKSPIEVMQLIGSIAEEAPRVAEFKAGRRRGASSEAAALASRDLTIDFSRVGLWGQHINAIVPFWNAHIQGVDKMGRQLANPKTRMTTIAKAGMNITAPSIGLMMLGRMDDRWKDIPDWQKNMFWIIPVPGGPVVRIPKPFELGSLFASLPERMIEGILDKDPSQVDAIQDMFLQTAPEFTTTLLGPLQDIRANEKAFTGGPVVSGRESKLPANLQYDINTPSAMRVLADKLGVLPGKWGETLGSPKKLDYLVKSYTGGLGRYAIEGASKAVDALEPDGSPQKPDKGLERQLFTGSFLVNTEQSKYTARLFALLDDLDTRVAGYKETGVRDRDFLTATRQHALLASTRKHVYALYKVVNAIEEHPRMSGADKAAKIRKIKQQIAELSFKAVTRAEGLK